MSGDNHNQADHTRATLVREALDPILADYVGPPIPHEAIAIVLDMAERAVLEALDRGEVSS